MSNEKITQLKEAFLKAFDASNVEVKLVEKGSTYTKDQLRNVLEVNFQNSMDDVAYRRDMLCDDPKITMFNALKLDDLDSATRRALKMAKTATITLASLC